MNILLTSRPGLEYTTVIIGSRLNGAFFRHILLRINLSSKAANKSMTTKLTILKLTFQVTKKSETVISEAFILFDDFQLATVGGTNRRQSSSSTTNKPIEASLPPLIGFNTANDCRVCNVCIRTETGNILIRAELYLFSAHSRLKKKPCHLSSTVLSGRMCMKFDEV